LLREQGRRKCRKRFPTTEKRRRGNLKNTISRYMLKEGLYEAFRAGGNQSGSEKSCEGNSSRGQEHRRRNFWTKDFGTQFLKKKTSKERGAQKSKSLSRQGRIGSEAGKKRRGSAFSCPPCQEVRCAKREKVLGLQRAEENVQAKPLKKKKSHRQETTQFNGGGKGEGGGQAGNFWEKKQKGGETASRREAIRETRK